MNFIDFQSNGYAMNFIDFGAGGAFGRTSSAESREASNAEQEVNIPLGR
jgi:hypothetical protein